MKENKKTNKKSNKKTKRVVQQKKKLEWSKILSGSVVIAGFVIAQEAMILMWYCISHDYSATAAWLTAAVGLAEAIIGVGLSGYLGLAKVEHKEGGITFESAKAKNFTESESSIDSPPI